MDATDAIDVSLRPFTVPLARQMETASGGIEARQGVVVAVEAEGVVGRGEASPLPGWTESGDACRRALARAVDRLADAGPAEALDVLADVPAARHGLQLALADLDARRAGEPLYRYLGAEDRVGSVPANATIGDADVPETVAAAEAAVDDGFGCLKVKVGARDVTSDVERLAAVREAVGLEPGLRADANGAWSRSDADEALGALSDLDVEYVEQPLAADDVDGHAELRGGPVGIAVDETLAAIAYDDVLAAEAADVLILKPMVAGGIDRAREAALAARDAGVRAVVTTTVDAVVARTGAVHLSASLPVRPPAGLATAGWLARDLGPDPAPVSAGSVQVPQAAGLGVELEEGSR